MKTLQASINESLFANKDIKPGELSNKILIDYLNEHIRLSRSDTSFEKGLPNMLTLEIDKDRELIIGNKLQADGNLNELMFSGDLRDFPIKIKQIKFDDVYLKFQHCAGLKNFKDMFSNKYQTWGEVHGLEMEDCPDFESFEGWPKIQEIGYVCLPNASLKNYKDLPVITDQIYGDDQAWFVGKKNRPYGLDQYTNEIDNICKNLPNCPVKKAMEKVLTKYYAKHKS